MPPKARIMGHQSLGKFEGGVGVSYGIDEPFGYVESDGPWAKFKKSNMKIAILLLPFIVGSCNENSIVNKDNSYSVEEILSNSSTFEGQTIRVFGCVSSLLQTEGNDKSGFVLYQCSDEIGQENYIVLNFSTIPDGVNLRDMRSEVFLVEGFFADSEVTGLGINVTVSFLEFARIIKIEERLYP